MMMLLTMFKNTFFPITIGIVLVAVSCGNVSKTEDGSLKWEDGSLKLEDGSGKTEAITVAANQTEAYLPLLKGKRVGIVANQTTVIFKELRAKSQEPSLFTHLVDSL